MNWNEFLEAIADELDEEERETFRAIFNEKGKITPENQLASRLNIGVDAVKKRKQNVFDKFAQVCPGISEHKSRGRSEILRVWLNKEYASRSQVKNTALSSSNAKAAFLSIPNKFQTLINDKTKGFVGRTYVFDEIADFLVKHPKGYFIIEGDPGMGKSAILAEYARRTGCVVHFNVQGQYETAEELLKTLCIELIDRYQITSKTVPTDVKQYGSFLDRLLAETAQNRNDKQIVIAIDALDEVDLSTQKSNDNILYLPRYLSEGIYFVMTRRRGVEIPFITDAPQQVFKLMDYENQSREDVRTYIQNRVNGSELLRQQIVERGETEAEFIEKIAEKSENNFMYLVKVLKDIEKGFYKNLSLERFPQGLQQYYEFHWRRMEMTVKPLPVTKINIVYHLAESHQPISCQIISEYVGEQQLTVQEMLDDWEQFLHKPIIEGETCYSIYHASFRDFLHRKDIVQAAGVSLKAINKQKSDNLWEAMFGDE